MFLSKHRLNMALLRIGKRRIVENIASLRKVNITHPYSQDAIPSGWSFATTKRAWKAHFWDPSQWDRMCFEYQRINFNGKNGSNIHICLRSGSMELIPPPLSLSLTVKYPFFYADNMFHSILGCCWYKNIFTKKHKNIGLSDPPPFRTKS